MGCLLWAVKQRREFDFTLALEVDPIQRLFVVLRETLVELNVLWVFDFLLWSNPDRLVIVHVFPLRDLLLDLLHQGLIVSFSWCLFLLHSIVVILGILLFSRCFISTLDLSFRLGFFVNDFFLLFSEGSQLNREVNELGVLFNQIR